MAILAAAWVLGLRAIRSSSEERRILTLAGAPLLAPFALVALLWVGLGPPWASTPRENQMRYSVLLAAAIAVAAGFTALKEALRDAGERLYSTLGLGASLLAGAAYVVWVSFALGASVAEVRDGRIPAAIASLSDVGDILLFVACVLTYFATAAFAASMRRAGWLGPTSTRAYLGMAFVALSCIVTRGLSFPDPDAGATPWYLRPGFIAGIPAVPWIMPFLMGVGLIRRAGDEPLGAASSPASEPVRQLPPFRELPDAQVQAPLTGKSFPDLTS